MVGLLRFYVWFPQDKAKKEMIAASKTGRGANPDSSSGERDNEENGEDLDVVRRRRVRRD